MSVKLGHFSIPCSFLAVGICPSGMLRSRCGALSVGQLAGLVGLCGAGGCPEVMS